MRACRDCYASGGSTGAGSDGRAKGHGPFSCPSGRRCLRALEPVAPPVFLHTERVRDRVAQVGSRGGPPGGVDGVKTPQIPTAPGFICARAYGRVGQGGRAARRASIEGAEAAAAARLFLGAPRGSRQRAP